MKTTIFALWFAAAAPAIAAVAPPLTASSVGSDRIEWIWDPVPGAQGYKVYADPPRGPYPETVAATRFVQDDLPSDATALIRVSAVIDGAEGPISQPQSAMRTLARPALGLSVAEARTNGATLTWFANGNSPETVAVVERSTDGVEFQNAVETTQWSYSANDLAVCTAYKFRVRYRNADGALSVSHGAVDVNTLSPPPSPVPFLQATALVGGYIKLAWSSPGTNDIAGYRIYGDDGTGRIDQETPLLSASSAAFSAVLGPFISSASYRFAVRTVSACGRVQAPPGAEASAPAMRSLSGVRARVAFPQAGARVAGRRVPIFAEFVVGDAGQARQVRFDYRKMGANNWTPLTPAGALQANPVLSAPFLVHWDVSLFAPGNYELRATAVDFSGRADAAAAAASFRIDPSLPTCVGENTAAGGTMVTARFGPDQQIRTGAALEDGYWAVLSGATTSHAGDEVFISLDPSPSSGPKVRVILPNSLYADSSRPFRLSLADPKRIGRGMLAGTSVGIDRLQLAHLDPATGRWVELATTRDAASRSYSTEITVSGEYSAVLQVSGLDTTRVFPNPFKPGSAAGEGKTFDSSDPDSGIVFDRLPSGAAIEIFDINGRALRRIAAAAGSSRVQWDARDSSGRDAATGIFLAVITAPDGTKITRKLLIVR